MGMDQGPTGEIVDIPEERLTTIHGVTVLHTTKYPIRAGDGRPKYLLGIAEDITELKAAEEGRRQAEEALRERVRVFTALAEFAGAVNSIPRPRATCGNTGRRRELDPTYGHRGDHRTGPR
jgi:PAS domain-containing protein